MWSGTPLSLLVVCSGKMLLEDMLGTGNPNAGYCAGRSGFDCVCDGNAANDGGVVANASEAPTSFDAWYSGLDEVADRAAATEPEIARKVSAPFVAGGKLIDNACEDRNENCSWWAQIGECQNNPAYILSECPSSCNVCRKNMHHLPREVRCMRDPAEPPIVDIGAPGGLTKMFRGILANEELVKRYNIQVVSTDPWILQFDNFATRAHWEFLEENLRNQFEGSTVVGGMDEATGHVKRQTLNTRTSQNAWCNLDDCYKSEVHRDLQDRLIEVLGPSVKRHHMEALQVLKYKPGTFYHPHHDTITDQIHMWSGPRMLNAFMYFNDKPTGGGETEFTHLVPPIKVKPVTGRMILWASQSDNDWAVPDQRTTHQACNVTEGVKEAANMWVHLYDYQTPSYMGCAG